MTTSPMLLQPRHSSWLSPVRRTALTVVVFVFGFAGGIAFGIVALYATGGQRCSVVEPPSISVNSESGSGAGNPVTAESPVGGGLEKRKLVGFVGIQTGFGSVGRRRSLRKTWFPSDQDGRQRLEESTGLAFRFVIGKTADSSKMDALVKEIEEYRDFLLLDIEESYSNLPHKTLAFFKASFEAFQADFYVKVDDDIYLRPDRLSLLLAKDRFKSRTYLGCLKKDNVITDPNHKWYEPLSNLLGMEYFLYASGAIYALSADVVSFLAAFKNDSLRMFTNEDVTVGAWMLAMNVNHEHVSAFCEKECTPSFIAVWDNNPSCSGLCNPEKNLLSLHGLQNCSSS